jgi:hypothetical protein
MQTYLSDKMHLKEVFPEKTGISWDLVIFQGKMWFFEAFGHECHVWIFEIYRKGPIIVYFSGKKMLYSRRVHCEHLNRFIAFSKKVVQNFKKLFFGKKSFILGHRLNLVSAYQMTTIGAPSTV